MKKLLIIPILVLGLFGCPSFVAASGASTLVIDEFRTRLGDSIYDEYVTLANYGSTGVDLAGFAVLKKTASLGSTPEPIYTFGAYSLAPGQTVTLGGVDYSGTNFLLYNGKGTLADTNNVIILKDKGGSTVDSVAYGTVTYTDIEGTALKNPAKGVSYKRTTIPENNDNSLDFEAYFPPTILDVNADKIVISELLPAPNEGKEWFELFNPTSLAVSLSGLKVCDAIGSVHCYYFPETEVLAPLQYKTYDQTITKITLNNTGDWLELRDSGDNLLADSGGNYGNADSGVSLSLFGSDFMWSMTPTPNGQNFFTDTVEEETTVSKAPKSTSKKVKAKLAAKTTSQIPGNELVEEVSLTEPKAGQTVVKGAKTFSEDGNTTLGYLLIILAVLLLVGYNLWERRDYARKLYDKISSRDR